MTTSQEIKEHFGQKGLNLVKQTFGYSNLRELNKDKEIKGAITYMVFSWYVDYGRKKWIWNIQDLITHIKNDKEISKMSNEEFFDKLFEGVIK
jgi:hypothetical protein